MQIMRNFTHGIFTVLRLTGAPLLYRYPHRNSGEALRGDWLKIAGDIESVMGKLKDERHGG
ncbi:MAG: hypothetical protein SFX19_03910 [Alphaproteobacteria bacterium]|nr:hypothetical protein [Alphaproteobacteria bacterium]